MSMISTVRALSASIMGHAGLADAIARLSVALLAMTSMLHCAPICVWSQQCGADDDFFKQIPLRSVGRS